jgi:hypothetical protein
MALVAREMFCRRCSYQLNGLIEPRCPECGRGFDPAAARTYRRRPKRRGLRLWLQRLAVAFVILFVVVAAGPAWLWWDWHRDQVLVEEFEKRHGASDICDSALAIHSPLLKRWLGARWGYLLDRAWWFSDSYDCPFTNEEIVAISRSRYVEILDVGMHTQLTDDTISRIGKMHSLTDLGISYDKMTNGDIQKLQGLTGLTSLELDLGPGVTDLNPIRSMSKLRGLEVLGDGVGNGNCLAP